MPKFGENSFNNLKTCHLDLVKLFSEVVKIMDCSVLCGARGASDQILAFRQERTFLVYPDSDHNPDYERDDLISLAKILICDPKPYAIKEAIQKADDETLCLIDREAPLFKSRAVDVVPYYPTEPHIDWRQEKEAYFAANKVGGMTEYKEITNNIRHWNEFAGFVKGVAYKMGIPIKWGGDWKDFYDMPHWYLGE